MSVRTQWPGTSTTSTRSNHDRIGSSGGEKKEIWSTLLNNVASGKKLPEKNLLVLGGTQTSQREFIESLSQERASRLKPQDRSRDRKVPIANRFALGYTYQNVYDSDHEDLLARLSLYTLNEPAPAYAPLLTRLLDADTIPNTAIAILLDWSEPWRFLRQLRAWIRLLRQVVGAVPQTEQGLFEDNHIKWQRNRELESGTSITDSHTSMPLGPGEYEEPLGLPIVVVCQNAQAVEQLEKERGYRESHFDFIMQFLRTTLLKHGAGLIYTMPSQPGQLQQLVHHILDIGSNMLGERIARDKADKGLKHNVVDRERVMVPLGWDSWGKIKVLREGFDVEGISRAWGVEIQKPPDHRRRPIATEEDAQADAIETVEGDGHDVEEHSYLENNDPDSTISAYEAEIQDPRPRENAKIGLEIDHKPDQSFLAEQLERLEAFHTEDESTKKQREQTRRTNTSEESRGSGNMQEHIGPVQFNMGGIQYDADEALKRLKDRTKNTPAPSQSTPERSRTRESTPFSPGSPPQFESGKDIPVENLEAYFASLMKGGRAGSSSVTNSPRVVSSPRTTQRKDDSSGQNSAG